eukprot:1761982-Rhodomonas_salina.5
MNLSSCQLPLPRIPAARLAAWLAAAAAWPGSSSAARPSSALGPALLLRLGPLQRPQPLLALVPLEIVLELLLAVCHVARDREIPGVPVQVQELGHGELGGSLLPGEDGRRSHHVAHHQPQPVQRDATAAVRVLGEQSLHLLGRDSSLGNICNSSYSSPQPPGAQAVRDGRAAFHLHAQGKHVYHPRLKLRVFPVPYPHRDAVNGCLPAPVLRAFVGVGRRVRG